jgi:L-threonylcarbamoyladenylate synthase
MRLFVLPAAAVAVSRVSADAGAAPLDRDAVARFARCIAGGGVALFPADTVYGLACDPLRESAVARLYELKGRPPRKPAAVMFFALAPALAALPELGERTRAALDALLPGPLTVLLPNPRGRFPLACPVDPTQRAVLGLRVPLLPTALAALGALQEPVMQSSANLAGGPEARRLEDVDASLRARVDVSLDGGELPGVASTVLDLADYEQTGRWRVVRAGPVDEHLLSVTLGA